jgi:hypothetical protein
VWVRFLLTLSAKDSRHVLKTWWQQLVDRHSRRLSGNQRRQRWRAALRLEPLEKRMVLSNPGDLDTTFGNGGLVNVELTGSLPTEFLNGLLLQPDGKLVAAGGANSGGQGGEFAVNPL